MRQATISIVLLISVVLLFCSGNSPFPSTEDVSLLLRLAREHVQEPSKSTQYYRKIITSLSSTLELEEQEFDGQVPDDPRYQSFSTALYELSDVLEKTASRTRNASAVSESFDYLFRAAGLGNTEAQHRLSAAYATGIYGGALVPVDAGRSLVLEYMSALGGNPEASMGMGYRYMHGIGVPESCDKAQIFYEYAANEAAEQIRLLGTGGSHPKHSERLKLSDVEVAVAKGRRDVDPEVIDYYKHLSAGGDANAANSLGNMYMQGSRFLDQDVDVAIRYFQTAADAGHVSASAQLGYLLVQRLSLKLLRQRKLDKQPSPTTTSGRKSTSQTTTSPSRYSSTPSYSGPQQQRPGQGRTTTFFPPTFFPPKEDYTQTASTIDDSDFDPRLPSSNSHSGTGTGVGGGSSTNRGSPEGGTETLDNSNNNGNILHNHHTTNHTESVKNETYVIQELDRIVKLFRYAANRGANTTLPQRDALGQVGLGFIHYTGLADLLDRPGQSTAMLGQLYGPNGRDGKKGMAKAYDIFFKVSSKHMDAGFYMGEILMGRDQMHANLKFAIPHMPKKTLLPSSSSSSSSTSSSSSSADSDIPVRNGHSSSPHPPRPPSRENNENNEEQDHEAYADQHVTGADHPQPAAAATTGTATDHMNLPHTQPHQHPRYIAVDPAAAAQSYAVASQRGNVLALHRVAHLSALGIGTARSCPSACKGFKSVAERGHWAHQLTEAHRLADMGDRAAALTLFSRKAAIGCESAQFNTAYLLMKETGDLDWMIPPPSAVRMSHALDRKAQALALAFEREQQEIQENQPSENGEVLSESDQKAYSSSKSGMSEVVVDHQGNTATKSTTTTTTTKMKTTITKHTTAAKSAAGGPTTAAGGESSGGSTTTTSASSSSIPTNATTTTPSRPSIILSALYYHTPAHAQVPGLDQAKAQGLAHAQGQGLGPVSPEVDSVRPRSSHPPSSLASLLSHQQPREQASEARALVLFALSASQGNAESYLKVGDFYYYGNAGLERDKFEAAVFYQMAADLRNTHAIFNLGIMHEAGDGVQQDFHLAKRFYDQAAEFDADARTPRALALMLLNSHRSLQETMGVETTSRLTDTLIETFYRAEMLRQQIMRWLGSRAVVSSSGGWVVKWLFPQLNHHGSAADGQEGGDMTERFYRDLSQSSGQRGSSQSPSSGTGTGTGGGKKQWRDLEGILFDAVKEYLRSSQLFAKGQHPKHRSSYLAGGFKGEVLMLLGLCLLYWFISRWRETRRAREGGQGPVQGLGVVGQGLGGGDGGAGGGGVR